MRIYITIFVMLLHVLLYGQTSIYPYILNTKTDITVIGVSGGLLLGSHFLKQNKASLTESQILLLDRNNINLLDRSATYNWSLNAKNASDILLFTTLAIPMLHLVNKEVRLQSGSYLLLNTQVLLATLGFTSITKELVQRKRPFTYNPNAPLHEKLRLDATASFFSGHTATSASMCFFFAQTYSYLYPNSHYKPYIWTSAVILPAVIGFLRWQAGKHFFTDIAVGYIVGTSVGVLIPKLHHKK